MGVAEAAAVLSLHAAEARSVPFLTIGEQQASALPPPLDTWLLAEGPPPAWWCVLERPCLTLSEHPHVPFLAPVTPPVLLPGQMVTGLALIFRTHTGPHGGKPVS